MKESSASSNTMHDLSAVLQLGPVVQVSLGWCYLPSSCYTKLHDIKWPFPSWNIEMTSDVKCKLVYENIHKDKPAYITNSKIKL
jgi:hypothetical protein